MNFAYTHNIIDSNPFEKVAPIKTSDDEGTNKRPLSLDEIYQFVQTVDEFWRSLFLLLFFSGIRIAEAAALKWKHIDLANGVAKIHQNLVRIKGGEIIYKLPKTKRSKRNVKIPEFVVESLHEQRKRTWKGNMDDFVFLNKAGRSIHPPTLNRCVINPTLKKLGISTAVSIKDTRASYITNALDQKERMSYVQKQFGHCKFPHYSRKFPHKIQKNEIPIL